jgi:hypothetical protein
VNSKLFLINPAEKSISAPYYRIKKTVLALEYRPDKVLTDPNYDAQPLFRYLVSTC